jgi:hypothetical protein
MAESKLKKVVMPNAEESAIIGAMSLSKDLLADLYTRLRRNMNRYGEIRQLCELIDRRLHLNDECNGHGLHDLLDRRLQLGGNDRDRIEMYKSFDAELDDLEVRLPLSTLDAASAQKGELAFAVALMSIWAWKSGSTLLKVNAYTNVQLTRLHKHHKHLFDRLMHLTHCIKIEAESIMNLSRL